MCGSSRPFRHPNFSTGSGFNGTWSFHFIYVKKKGKNGGQAGNGGPGFAVSGRGAEQEDELQEEEAEEGFVLMFNLTRLLHRGSVPRP